MHQGDAKMLIRKNIIPLEAFVGILNWFGAFCDVLVRTLELRLERVGGEEEIS